MKRKELKEAPERTDAYNDEILSLLDGLGIVAREEGHLVAVSRDSMVEKFPEDGEEKSYALTLQQIRLALPNKLYIIWAGKTDDDYFVEVYIR